MSKRMLIGYVVRLEAPGEKPTWLGYGDQPTDRPRQRRYFRVIGDASWRATGPHARAVPVYLRVRP